MEKHLHLTTKIEQLAVDLRWIEANGVPQAATLETAPLLVNWRRVLRPCLQLEGDVIRHPRLGSTTGIVTSQVFWLAPDLGAVRTLSRFYRLAEPFPF